jgi:hypothetical protein
VKGPAKTPTKAFYFVPPPGEGDPYRVAEVGPFSNDPNAVCQCIMTDDKKELARWRKSLAGGKLPPGS